MALGSPCGGLESEGETAVLTLKTQSKVGGFVATPDQMGWANEECGLLFMFSVYLMNGWDMGFWPSGIQTCNSDLL